MLSTQAANLHSAAAEADMGLKEPMDPTIPPTCKLWNEAMDNFALMAEHYKKQ